MDWSELLAAVGIMTIFVVVFMIIPYCLSRPRR
jgi:hypothetical protein